MKLADLALPISSAASTRKCAEAANAGRSFGRSRVSENQLQADIVRALRKMGLLVVAIPNGGKRRPREARQLKNRGVVAGFPDIQVMRPNKRVDLLELKTDSGKLSDKQFALHSKLTSMGFAVHVVRSVDEAVRVFA